MKPTGLAQKLPFGLKAHLMQVIHSSQLPEGHRSTALQHALGTISKAYLHSVVKAVSIPRNYYAEKDNNKQVARWIREQLESFGYQASFQGEYDNVVAVPKNTSPCPYLLAGTHYDTVPGSPGADDNGSSIAVILACAKALSELNVAQATMFVIFNLEENRLQGSKDFVHNYLLKQNNLQIKEAHVLEMVGYCARDRNTQRIPRSLPISLPDVGNFLGVIGNRASNNIVAQLLGHAKTYLEGFPVIGLQVFWGLEKLSYHLQRSDHRPFWKAGIPALMWTDTSEFRNPHYHQPSDTPATLDYRFMNNVARLLLVHILKHETCENWE